MQNELSARGHQVLSCFGRGSEVSDPNVRKISLDLETSAHFAGSRLLGINGTWSPLSTRRLLKIIDTFKPDVIHLHELHGYFLDYYSLVKEIKKRKINTVWTFHCEIMYTGRCGHSNDCDKWKTGCGGCPDLKSYPRSYIFDFSRMMWRWKREMFEGFDRLIITTPSNWLEARVRESFLFDKKVKTVYNGIDSEIFRIYPEAQKKTMNFQGKIFNFLAVSTELMTHQKGGRILLEIARALEKFPVRFTLVGVDPKEVEGLNLTNVVAIGRVTNQMELAKCYNEADLLILPSKRETFSLVCAESLACGTPVVGFLSGAPEEIVPDGYGAFVANGDADALKNVLLSFISKRLTFKSPEKCSAYAHAHFSQEVMVDRFLDVYHEFYQS
jgi:glycosyltransferase involved in cell wall biosynthesis